MRQLCFYICWLWSLSVSAQQISVHRQIKTDYESHAYQDEKAIETIETASSLAPGTQVAYRAGQSIVLTNGFIAHPGSVFSATIQPVSADGEFGMRLVVAPNPVGSSTLIDYVLPTSGEIALFVTDVKGNSVQQLIKERKESGTHVFNWDSSQIETGVYICVLRLGNQSLSVRIVKQ